MEMVKYDLCMVLPEMWMEKSDMDSHRTDTET
jgi:hypothetical protein